MDADWLYDLGRTIHVPDALDAGQEQDSGEDQPVAWDRVVAVQRGARRAAPFRNVLPPIQHTGYEEF